MDNHLRKTKQMGKRVGKWFGRKIVRIITMALTIALVIALLPYVRGWVAGLLPGLDFDRTSQLLTHQMEEVGELIADRHTDTGRLYGKISVFVSVEAEYTYEIGIGIKLADVTLTPGEDGILVEMPEARVLYDSFTINGDPKFSDPLNLRQFSDPYQRLVEEQHAACRQGYEENPSYMDHAWDTAADQLGQLFVQWAGEDLPLTFVHKTGEAAPALPAEAE